MRSLKWGQLSTLPKHPCASVPTVCRLAQCAISVVCLIWMNNVIDFGLPLVFATGARLWAFSNATTLLNASLLCVRGSHNHLNVTEYGHKEGIISVNVSEMGRTVKEASTAKAKL